MNPNPRIVRIFLTLALFCGSLQIHAQWNQTDIGTDRTLASVALLDSDTILISGFDGTFKTFNGGTSWSVNEVNLPATYFTDLYFTNSKRGIGSGPIVSSNTLALARTTDGTANWSLIYSDNTGNWPREFRDLEFLNPMVGYAIGSNGKFFKTIDGGNTWVTQAWNGSTDYLAASFFSETEGIILSTMFCIRVRPDGSLQTLFSSSLRDLIDLKMVDSKNVFVVSKDKLRYSSNGGTSWTIRNLPFADVTDMFVADVNRVYVGTENGLFITYDKGITWEKFKALEGVHVEDIKVLPGGKGVVVGRDGACFITSNFGGPSAPILKFNYSEEFFCGSSKLHLNNESNPAYTYQWLINGEQVSTNDSDVITFTETTHGTISLIGSNGVLSDTVEQQFYTTVQDTKADAGPDQYGSWNERIRMQSTNEGYQFSWSPTTNLFDPYTQNPNPTILNPVCIAETTMEYILTISNGMGCTDRDTVTIYRYPKIPPINWVQTSATSSLPISAIEFANDTVGIALARNKLLQTTNGGLTWTQNPVFLGERNHNDFNDVHMISPDTFYLASRYVYRTLNGGETFTRLSSGGFEDVMDMEFVTDSIIYAGTHVGLYKSIDAGQNWNAVSSVNMPMVFKIDCITPQKCVCVGGPYGAIFQTENGTNWTRVLNPANSALIDVQFVDETTVYAGGFSGPLFKSTDGGKNWVSIYEGFIGGVWSINFLNKDVGYIGTSQGTIYKTLTGGKSWQLLQDASTGIINRIYFANPKLAFIATGVSSAQHGVILRTSFAPIIGFEIENGSKCTEQTFTVTNTSVGFEEHTWVIDGVEQPYTGPLEISFETPGDHIIGLRGNNPEEAFIGKRVTVQETPVKPHIQEDIYSLKSSATTNVWYLQNSFLENSYTSTITPEESGVYTVRSVSESGECLSETSDPFTFTFRKLDISIPAERCQDNDLQAYNISEGFDSYNWILDGQPVNSEMIWVIAPEPRNYQVKLIGHYKELSDTLTFTSKITPIPTLEEVFLGEDIEITQGEIVTLTTPAQFVQTLWSTGEAAPGIELNTTSMLGSFEIWAQAINSFSCARYDTIQITVVPHVVTGLDPESTESFLVYPNPAKPGAEIKLQGFSGSPDQLSLITSFGQEIKLPVANGGKEKNVVVLPSNLMPGMYMLKAASHSQKYSVKLLIRQ